MMDRGRARFPQSPDSYIVDKKSMVAWTGLPGGPLLIRRWCPACCRPILQQRGQRAADRAADHGGSSHGNRVGKSPYNTKDMSPPLYNELSETYMDPSNSEAEYEEEARRSFHLL